MAMDFVAKPTHMLGCIALGLLLSCVSCTNGKLQYVCIISDHDSVRLFTSRKYY